MLSVRAADPTIEFGRWNRRRGKRFGAPGEVRTPDPQVRSLMLYPAELRAHEINDSRFFNIGAEFVDLDAFRTVSIDHVSDSGLLLRSHRRRGYDLHACLPGERFDDTRRWKRPAR